MTALIMEQIKKITLATPIALGLTLLSILLVAIIQGAVSLDIMVFSILVAALQLFFAWFRKAYTILLPLELMTTKVEQFNPKWYRSLVAPMSLLPLVANFSLPVAISLLLILIILSLKSLKVLLRVLIKRKQFREEYLNLITAYNPEVIIYMSGLSNAAYMINQWLPVLDRLKEKSLILIRERAIYEKMDQTKHPVVFARSTLDLEASFKASESLKVILYPANPQKNTQSLRHYEYQHYFINHGESDKAVNQSKLLMAYDKLLVGGPLAKRRMEGAQLPLRADQVEYVGRPQAELLLDTITEPQPIKTLLYAPTWEGFVDNVNYASVNEQGYQLLKDLAASSHYRVLFKPHPYTGARNATVASYLKKMKALCDGKTLELVETLTDIHDCMNQSDLIITDISSVLNEYLVTNKPMILCNTRELDTESLHQDFPSSCAAYLLNPKDKILHLLESIKQQDIHWQQRLQVRIDSLGDPITSALERFQEVITRGCQQ